MQPRDIETKLTAEDLKRRFSYDSETGKFVYLVIDPYNAGKLSVGQEAGHVRDGLYRMIKIDGHAYYAHRLAWLYVHGRWPVEFIDHIDRDKLNNRIANLREVNKQENSRNKSGWGKSGIRGVSKQRGRWKAQITHDGVSHYIGLFGTQEEAYAAYVAKGEELHSGMVLKPHVHNRVTWSPEALNPTPDVDMNEYVKVLLDQNGRCRSCDRPETKIKHGKIMMLGADLDEDGKIKGLLCECCRNVLKSFNRDPVLMQSAIDYLKRH